MNQDNSTLKRILKLCEALHNQDIEGKDEEDKLDDAELVISQITEMTIVELAEQEHQLATRHDRELKLRAALMEYVRVENIFGHTGQHTDEECADCKRVRQSHEALSHGYLR